MTDRQRATGRKVTARKVARAVKLTESTFSRYLNSEDPPPDDVLEPLAKYFHVRRGWLRYEEDPKYAETKGGTKEAGLDAAGDDRQTGTG